MDISDEPSSVPERERLTGRLRQLILMRETGPKSPRWHAVRSRLIWRTHDALAALEPPPAAPEPASEATPEPPRL